MSKEEISALYWKTIGDIKLLDGLLEGSFRDQDYDRLIEIVNGITKLLQDLRGDHK